jgi:hypothetical protein
LVLKNREKKVTPVPLPDRITKRMEAAFLMNLSLPRVCANKKKQELHVFVTSLAMT